MKMDGAGRRQCTQSRKTGFTSVQEKDGVLGKVPMQFNYWGLGLAYPCMSPPKKHGLKIP